MLVFSDRLNPLSLGSPSRALAGIYCQRRAFWSQSPFVGVSFQSGKMTKTRAQILLESQSPFVGVSFQSFAFQTKIPNRVELVSIPFRWGLLPESRPIPRRRGRVAGKAVSIPFRWGLLPESTEKGSRPAGALWRLNPLSLGSPSRVAARDLARASVKIGYVSIPFRWGLLPE